MKKKIALLLVLCVMICTACGTKGTDTENENSTDIGQNWMTKPEQETPSVSMSTQQGVTDTNQKQEETTPTAHKHNFSDATCTEASKCECGDTNGYALGHSWEDAGCDVPQTCKTCGATSGVALGHNYSAADCDSPQTCSRCGMTQGSELGHSYIHNICSRCGATDPDSLPVALNSLVVIDANPSSWYSYDSGLVKDSYGNAYAGYYEYTSNMFDPVIVNYNLGGKYKTFSCDLIAPDYTESKAVLDLLIYVDDQLMYYVTDYTKLSGLKHIELDVTGGQRLTIQVSKTNDEGIATMYNTESVAFVNAVLEK